jgi:hypothetical protein
MSAPDPYAGSAEEFSPDLHWGAFPGPIASRTFTGEAIANTDPSGENFFSQEAGEASLVGVVNSSRLRGCLRYFLGFNNMTTVASYTLQRTNPIVHPRFTNLVCTGVSCLDFFPVRYSNELPAGSANSGLKLPRNQDNSGAVAVTEAGPGSTTRSFPFYAGYSKSRVTARFSPAPYKFLADDAGLKEYQRNTIIDTDPRTEVLTLSGFQLVYAEGTGNTGNLSNPKGNASPGEVAQVLVKPDVIVKWFRVPEKFISQNTIPGHVNPAKILRGLGTLNRYAWLTYRKGTLLLVGAKLTRKPWALAAGIGTTPPTGLQESIFNYDIELLFSFFDPPKGYTGDAAIVDATSIGTGTTGADCHGHNLVPWRGSAPGTVLAGEDKNQGKWFLATYSGLANYIGNPVDVANVGSRCLFEYSNYDNLFDSVWNADLT